jgi:branched-chain amino acid transport system substrate-binding protein
MIADFDPFSGPNSAYGFFEEAGCIPAVNLINKAGGVLGHRLFCQVVDNRGDPADAVPAAQKLLATSPNLVGIVDQDSGLLTATVPLFNAAHISDISVGGDIQFDKNQIPYFWRTIPGDDIAGFAQVAYVKFHTTFTRVASVMTTDQSAQGNIPGIVAGAKNLGLNLTINLSIAPDQPTYQTEIQRVLASQPQVIVMEQDPQTLGVFLRDLKRAGGLMPMIGTSGTVGTNYDLAATAAIGADDFNKYFVRVVQYAPSTGAAWEIYRKGLLASASQIPQANTYVDQIYAEAPYDDVNLLALAMEAAKSTDPVTYNPFIARVVEGGTAVHNFADGKAALDAGKTIDYVGVEGQITFDKYHNYGGIWGVFRGVGTNVLIDKVTPQDVQASTGV